MSLLDELAAKKRSEDYRLDLGKQAAQAKEDAYLRNRTRIDEKRQAIESYITEINKVAKQRVRIHKSQAAYELMFDCGTDVRGRRMTLVFQSDDVEIRCLCYELDTEDKTGDLSVKVDDITSERIDAWLRFVTGYGGPPVKLKSRTQRKDAKILRTIGLILLLIIGSCVVYFKFLS